MSERLQRDLGIVVRPAPMVIGPASAVTIEAPARQAWDEKRWRRIVEGDDVRVVGAYRVFDRRQGIWREFDGEVRQQGRRITTYIANPPIELKTHRHGSCLMLVEPPWFLLHWERRPSTIDDALLYMERLLDEAINHAGR